MSASSLVASARANRQQRAQERLRAEAATRVTALFRGHSTRTALAKRASLDLRRVLADGNDNEKLFEAARRFVCFANVDNESVLLEQLLKQVVESFASTSLNVSYVALMTRDKLALPLIWHMKRLIFFATRRMSCLRNEDNSKEVAVLLSFLLGCTSSSSWLVFKTPKMTALAKVVDKLASNLLSHALSPSVDVLAAFKAFLLNQKNAGESLKKPTWSAIVVVIGRALGHFEDEEKKKGVLRGVIINILALPGLVAILEQHGLFSSFAQHNLLQLSFNLLSKPTELQSAFLTLEANFTLCLAGNLIHLSALQPEFDVGEMMSVTSGLFSHIERYVVSRKKASCTHWHPLLGWFAVPLRPVIQDTLKSVQRQLSMLWQTRLLHDVLMKVTLTKICDRLPKVLSPPLPPPDQLSSAASASGPSHESIKVKELFKKALEHARARKMSNAGASPGVWFGNAISDKILKIESEDFALVGNFCHLYLTSVRTLSQLRSNILSGLSRKNEVVKALWHVLMNMGSCCGIKQWTHRMQEVFKDNCASSSSPSTDTHRNGPKLPSEFEVLMLFADILTYLLTLLDDVEMYEMADSEAEMNLADYAYLSTFVNQLLYKALHQSLITDPNHPFFSSLHALLHRLYTRNSRRPFTTATHWLIPELNVSSFMSDLSKNQLNAKLILEYMPHALPHHERVMLFRRRIREEKIALGIMNDTNNNDDDLMSALNNTLISVHRNRLLEDGYRQLGKLGSKAMKGLIRVKFINQQGLDEAGIDQDGVFKEFLEESLKAALAPELNLFCSTFSSHALYPSTTSGVTMEQHLSLFEFVGKLLGKAIYEGIVVDVPLAPFFLSQVLDKTSSQALYSFVDELPSLDEELYRNLAYVKHYEGDVADLELTFSFQQDVMGEIVTHELIPGGKAVCVTNENRIGYIHHMAHYRMHTQIRQQTTAFKRGFSSVIHPSNLTMFSTPEVQRLLSGDENGLDVRDLRNNTHYYGGFHDSHRVVSWLWDILEQDFDQREKSAFLKFVTACSKPPLLGFKHLQPPFSVRCVEVAEDDDQGDTMGSWIRGYLALNRMKKDPVNRLPTASTCFNLLKLPNYRKRSTLREKLRYAITNNTGFELS